MFLPVLTYDSEHLIKETILRRTQIKTRKNRIMYLLLGINKCFFG